MYIPRRLLAALAVLAVAAGGSFLGASWTSSHAPKACVTALDLYAQFGRDTTAFIKTGVASYNKALSAAGGATGIDPLFAIASADAANADSRFKKQGKTLIPRIAKASAECES
jgi:hypothetical protein